MKHILTHYITFASILMGTILLGEAHAQMGTNNTITPVVIMTPNPSPFLSDWQLQRECIRLNIALTQPMSQPVKLMAQVSLNGQVVARTKAEKMPVLSLHQGVNSFVAADIIPLQAVSFIGGIDQVSQRAGRLPEGRYEICIWFANAENGMPIISAPCQPFMIQQFNPVTLISPQDGASFTQNPIQRELTSLNLQSCQPITLNELATLDKQVIENLKGFILNSGNTQTPYIQLQNFVNRSLAITGSADQKVVRFTQPASSGKTLSGGQQLNTPNFQWLPPMPTPAMQVQYKLLIVPVLPGQSAQQAMLTATPAFEQDGISTTTFTGTESISRLFSLAGGISTFAWSVEAHDASGNPIGSNNGWSEVRMFDILSDHGTDRLPIDYHPKVDHFFDLYTDLEMPKAICGKHALWIETKFGPWRLGKSYSQYYNVWVRNVYKVYRIIDCGLEKGHAGPHHGSSIVVYVIDREDKSDDHGENPPAPTPGFSTDKDPAKNDQMSKDDIQKILDNDKAPKDAGTDGTDKGSGTGTGSSGGTGSTGTGGGLAPGGKTEDPKAPCPEIKKKLLRTVIGSWKKVSTVVRHAAYRKTVIAWVDVTWQRDIWNVYLVQHCTLEKGHGGDHKWDAGHEEWRKYGTVTEKVTYGVGVPESEPKDHWSDSAPHEDPPRNAIFMK